MTFNDPGVYADCFTNPETLLIICIIRILNVYEVHNVY